MMEDIQPFAKLAGKASANDDLTPNIIINR
jgi:hypothetical protein